MIPAFVLLAVLAVAAPAAAEYSGPIVDAHSHVPNAAAIDAYAAAMKRHRVVKVVLLGVGGVQKDDAAWIAAAAGKYPDLVVLGQPVPDPTAPENLERPCGRGLLLIRYYMSSVTFQDNGRTIVMHKERNGK